MFLVVSTIIPAMKLNRFLFRFSILCLMLIQLFRVNAQNRGDTILQRVNYLPATEIIRQFEQLNGIRIYYRPEWFEDRNLAQVHLEKTTADFIHLIARTSKCSVIETDSVSFVLVDSDISASGLFQGNDAATLIVGNPDEYGKYRKALISGTVRDGKNGETLPGVSVFVEKLKLGATTDPSGHFQLELPVGEYDVTISFIGYEPSLRHIRLVSNGTADFDLFDKSHLIEEVVVTLDRPEFNVSRTQMSLIRLDNKSIRELPVSLGEIDIIKSVTLLPGIQSSGEFGTGLFVRGGSADQNLILIEEVPIFNASHLFGLTSIVNPDNISGVTLLKAGIPARYGERSSSVMDIRMGAPDKENVKVRGGFGLLNSKISVNLPYKNRFNLLLGGRTSYSNWLLHKIPDVDLMNSLAGFYDLNGMITLLLNQNNRISLFGYISNDRFSIRNKIDYAYGNRLGSARWNHIFGKTLSSALVAGFSDYNYLTSETDSFRRSSGYRVNSSLRYRNLKFNLTWIPSRRHTIEAGFNGISYNVSPGALEPYDSLSLVIPLRLSAEHALEYGFYVSDNLTLSPRLSAEAGIRFSGFAGLGPGKSYVYDPLRSRSPESITDTVFYNKNEITNTFSGLEPRFSLRYSFTDHNSLKISFTRIHQYINMISNTSVMNPADIWKLSNNYIRPLVNDQLAVGFFHNFVNNAYETSLEVYYKKLRHVIEYRDGASLLLNPTLEADLLDASGYNYGAELYVKKNSGRMTGWLSYTLSTSRRRTHGPTREYQVNGNRYFPSSYDQPHSLNMVGNYHISRRWRFSWTFTYNTGRPVTLPELSYTVGDHQLIWYSDRNKYRLPDYHRLDVAITRDESLRIKKFWKGSWTLSVINLYGRKNKYSVYFQNAPPVESTRNRPNSLYALYIIGRPLPTLTYNFTF